MSPKPEAAAAPVLVKVGRGELIESQHRGHIAVVTGEGELLASVGNVASKCFFRSSAKPFQCLPLVESGAADHFGFTPAEIALACASHSGQEIHVATAASMLLKTGLTQEQLHCGVHWPFNKKASDALLKAGERPTALHNNCSGKHAGMLALAKFLGADLATYEKLDHQVQQKILETISEYAGVRDIVTATDGCSVPTFGLTIKAMAQAFCNLGRKGGRVVEAMMAHPEMVGGTGELDTELMRVAGSKLVCKGGAETLFCAAVLPNSRWREGLGLAVKIEDGQNTRTRGPVALEMLRQLEILSEPELAQLGGFRAGPLTNHRGIKVGEFLTVFQLRTL